MLEKAKALHQLRKIQSQLAKEVVEVDAGDGAVTVQISGEQKVKKVSLDPDKIGGDYARLEGWLESAISQAIVKSQQLAAEKMKEITGSLGIPGM